MVYFAYESIAVYDALNSIHREFRPFYYDGRGERNALEEAAAIAAAHRVLVCYFLRSSEFRCKLQLFSE